MPRQFASITTDILNDAEFGALSSGARSLYYTLLLQKDITAAGTLPLTVRRWARAFAEDERRLVPKWLDELAAGRFVLVDEDTEEVLVRKFVKWDGGYKHGKRVLAVVGTARAIESDRLRYTVATELATLGVETDIKVPTDWQSIGNRMPPDDSDRETGTKVDTTGRHRQSIGNRLPPDRQPVPTLLRDVVTEVSTYQEPGTLTQEPEDVADDDLDPAVDECREDVTRICNHLADRIKANGSKRPPIGKGWREAARLMLDNDSHDEQGIHQVIDWCQDSEFWRANVLSMRKLREKYDQLRLQARSRGQPRRTATSDAIGWARADEEPTPEIEGRSG